ncbi:MAG: excinuclease ABC subunit A [Verrucomicrobia bacterium]|nr:MAG: excinuclease ABC subunit A [Verrucomicrobiota bacterium]TAE88597.1 MAG: excinuclease ABC subunit A [Verrucomicrobiota bacterium]TAF27054.1 MAG: excinuclease ABC subunit A [Verrucomicrobiota bacterium]TAF42310.1 MAG: excinuclease ABC subunit A [Verrucomicrobiota bacterium]
MAIRGARQHNLRGLDLDLPLGQLTVVTGPSGSGKSSLAFHTLYAEGQRRYVETFSPYVRQFFDRMDKPDVDRIDGIPPAIAIEQKNNIRTTRSTVGTLTEINDYLKLLFARVAKGYDPDSGEEICPDSPDSAAAWAYENLPGQQVLVTFPVSIPPDTPGSELFPFLSRQGYLRILLEGQILRTDEPSPNPTRLPSTIAVIQDRIPLTKPNRTRFLEALEHAFTLGKGTSAICHLPSGISKSFTTSWTNPATGNSLRPPSSALFSFNNPLGACPKCRGFGRVIGLDLEKSIPDPSLSIRQGAIKPFQGERGDECQRDLIRCCKERHIDINTPWEDLDDDERDWIYYGDRRQKTGAGSSTADSMEELEALWQSGEWYGIQGFFDWLESKAYKMHVRIFLSRYRSYTTCSTCRGRRLQPEALCFKIDGKTLPELWTLPIAELSPWFENLRASIGKQPSSTDLILTEITNRLLYLGQVGLGYLTLDRPARTLSGGEIERVNLTTCLGASLTNTLFVLDEPTVGLHPRDIQRLVGVMHGLRDKGNTLVVVEHEEAVMRAADQLLDIGPGAGQHGGTLVFQGKVPSEGLEVRNKAKKVAGGSPAAKKTPASDRRPQGTLPWLTGEKFIAVPTSRRQPGTAKIEIRGAQRHNLKKLDADLPLGLLVCLTGVSGSGKSTFAHDVLYANIARKLRKEDADLDPAPLKELRGTQYLSDILLVDQSPLARTPRSTPAVLVGAFDPIRQLFAQTEDAKARELTTGFFSFNSGDGRCDRCAGAGSEKVEMQFLSDLHVTCPDCQGRRYKPSTLDLHYLGKSIADILDLSVDEALAFYGEEGAPVSAGSDQRGTGGPPVLSPPTSKRHQQICKLLQPLAEVGLGYLKLGQPLNTLSGGESQRLKLCQLLAETTTTPSKRGAGGPPASKLLILDEPTTGLHFSDIERLLAVFQRLVDAGHSLLVIEHNLDVIKCADWILDLGPEAGKHGGQLVAEGPPEHIATLETETARFLKPALHPDTSPTTHRKTPAPIVAQPPSSISLRGAREHNLKNISLDIPRDRFVVVSGLSGSGKSTLAFDILFAEGQRRFLDSMSAYARQFAEQLEKPELDSLAGLPPTVAIEQRVSQGGMKSTVATVTELWNFIRLLYAKLGTRYCPDCQVPVEKQSLAAIENRIRELLQKGPVSILAPVIRGRKGYHSEVAEWALKQGYSKLLVNKQFREAEGFTRLERFKEHDIDVVVWESQASASKRGAGGSHAGDQIVPSTISKALDIGKGVLKLFTPDKKFILLSSDASCPCCQKSFEELDPRLFSFNSPHGWCTHCRGHGMVPKQRFHIDTSRFESVLEAEMDADRKIERMDDDELVECPSCQGARLNPEARAVRLQTPRRNNNPRGERAARPLQQAAANDAPSIAELSHLSVQQATTHFQALTLDGDRAQLIARDILPEIRQRLRFLSEVGLGYLQLDRSARTLSGGESQRIRLAAQLGSNLRGVLYVLDEPTIGLHPRDNAALLETLVALRDRGNSLIVVEHDEDTIARADHLIDLGPGAGRLGGEVVYQGPPPEVPSAKDQVPKKGSKASKTSTFDVRRSMFDVQNSPTYRALANPIVHPMRGSRRAVKKDHPFATVSGCVANNLKSVTAAIPLSRLTVLTGISGSGKSTLMHAAIADAARTSANRKSTVRNRPWSKATGFDKIQSTYEVDQSPIGKTSRSCPATYVKIFDDIRKLFAQLPDARVRGYEASRFSFNTGDGRCPVCEGNGRVKLEMDFLPSTWVPCEACAEMRYNPATLEVRFREKNIGEVLRMTIEQAAAFFESQPRIAAPLQLLADTGLGYLQLGQPSPTLSGGEAQRIKLVTELTKGRVSAKNLKTLSRTNLYLIEEPTVGLHLEDVKRLIDVLHRLVDEGHTVIVIEHHMAVAAEADWILDLGPEAGDGGGEIIAQGPPELVAKSKKSRTAPFLATALGGSRTL